MNKSEFIAAMEAQLIRLPKADRDDILNDYESHFVNGIAEGRTEEEVSAQLGDPVELAAVYLEHLPEGSKGAPYIPVEEPAAQTSQPENTQYNNQYDAWNNVRSDAQNTQYSAPAEEETQKDNDPLGIVAVVLLSIFVALPVLWAIAGVILGAFGASLGCFVAGVVMVGLGISTMGWSVVASVGIILLAVAVAAFGMLAMNLGILGVKGTIWLVKWYVSLCKKMIGGNN